MKSSLYYSQYAHGACCIPITSHPHRAYPLDEQRALLKYDSASLVYFLPFFFLFGVDCSISLPSLLIADFTCHLRDYPARRELGSMKLTLLGVPAGLAPTPAEGTFSPSFGPGEAERDPAREGAAEAEAEVEPEPEPEAAVAAGTGDAAVALAAAGTGEGLKGLEVGVLVDAAVPAERAGVAGMLVLVLTLGPAEAATVELEGAEVRVERGAVKRARLANLFSDHQQVVLPSQTRHHAAHTGSHFSL
jgi:hypothetical protein